MKLLYILLVGLLCNSQTLPAETVDTQVTIIEAVPTVFFKQINGKLHQRIDLQIQSEHATNELTLQIQFADQHFNRVIPALTPGINKVSVYLPDFQQSTRVNLLLSDGDAALVRFQDEWQPKRHWDIYMVHSSHLDLGYTDLPNRVLEEHKGHLEKVIEYCEETENWPEGSRFHFLIEQGWPVAYFMEHLHDEELKDKFIHFLQNGQIEVTALFGNQNIDMSSPEEVNRLIYPSFKLQKKYGFEIKTAETNDMPGINWGVISVLHNAGIRYFYAGIQDYFNWGQPVAAPWDEEKVMNRNAAGAFYWEGPDRQKVLFWYGGGDIGNVWLWNQDQAEDEIARYLEKHENNNYPYDILLTRVLGGYRDNSLPDIRHSEIVRKWNQTWAYPKIRFTNSTTFFEKFEQQHGKSLRTIRGDFNPTDYNIGAICTPRETGINRLNQRDITEAEKFATLASYFTDWTYPRGQIDESYERIQLYNEHCWGMQHPTGPAHAATISQKLNHSYQAAALIEDVKVKAINKLADLIDLSDTSYYLVVYNSLGHTRSDPVTVAAYPTIPAGKPFYREQRTRHNHTFTIWRAGEAADRKLFKLPTELLEKPFTIKDLSTGKSIPHQVRVIDDPLLPITQAASRMSLSQVTQNSVGGLNYKENQAIDLHFIAENIPPLGYKVFQIIPGKTNQPETNNTDEAKPLENDFYKVKLDDQDLQVIDKSSGNNVFRTGSPYFPGQFFVRTVSDGNIEIPEIKSMEIIENGLVFTTIAIKATHRNVPVIRQEVTLYHQIKRIDFATRILKDPTPYQEYFVAFPFNLEQPQFKIRSANSVIEPIVDQLPGTNTDAYTARDGVLIHNQDQYIIFSSVEAPIVMLSKLWPGYVSQAHHGRTPLNYDHKFTDRFKQSDVFSLVAVNNFRTNFTPVYSGDMLFRYSITSSYGSYNTQENDQFNSSVAHPLIPVIMHGPKKGNIGLKHSFFDNSNLNLELTTVKASEDGKGIILRLMETSGQSGVADISLNDITCAGAWYTNIQEDKTKKLVIEQNKFSIGFTPFSIITIYLEVDHNFTVGEKYFHSY